MRRARSLLFLLRSTRVARPSRRPLRVRRRDRRARGAFAAAALTRGAARPRRASRASIAPSLDRSIATGEGPHGASRRRRRAIDDPAAPQHAAPPPARSRSRARARPRPPRTSSLTVPRAPRTAVATSIAAGTDADAAPTAAADDAETKGDEEKDAAAAAAAAAADDDDEDAPAGKRKRADAAETEDKDEEEVAAKAAKRDADAAAAAAPEADAADAEAAPDAAAAAAADVFWETDEATGKAFFELPCAGHEGRVIGRGGETIKYIENRFSVKLDMKRDRGVVRCAGAPASLPECRRIVTEVIDTGDIKDRPSADNFTLGGAAGMVAQLIAAAAANGTSALGGANDPDLPEHLKGSDPDETVVVDVPCPGQEGRVIGKGGATIKEIERQSGAGMKVEKGSGKCSIHGALARVIVARRAVMDAMNLVQDFRRVLSFPHWSPYDPVRAVNADP